MITLLLVTHILVAISSLILAGVTLFASYNKRPSNHTSKMWFATLASLISGVVLVVVSNASIASSCIPLASLLFLVLGAQLSQKLVPATQKTKN